MDEQDSVHIFFLILIIIIVWHFDTNPTLLSERSVFYRTDLREIPDPEFVRASGYSRGLNS